MFKNTNVEQVNTIKQEAWRQFSSGQIEAANTAATKLYESGIVDAELTYLLGCCQAKLGLFNKAIVFFKESLTCPSQQANQDYTNMALAAACFALNQYDQSIKYYENIIRVSPNLVDAYLGMGEVCMIKGDIDRAEKSYLKARALTPNSGLPNYKLGHIEKQRENFYLAEKHFKKAVDCEPEVVDYQSVLAQTLIKIESFQEARKVCAKVLQLSPLSKIALGGLSVTNARLGNYSEAINAIDIVLAQQYLIVDTAIGFLIVSKHVNRLEEAIEYGQRCLSIEDLPENMVRSLHSHLALTLDHCQRYDEAWHHINACKKYKYSLVDDYDPVVFKVAVDNIISTFTPAILLGVPSSTVKHDYAPIFIVGMPRSGTSLVEQILASHSNVTACGELAILNDLIVEIPAILKSEKNWPFCISEMTQEHINFLSREYLKRIPGLKKQTVFITDKMPHNFFALGLIQLLFPKTKIIHCRRQPLDTCISIYFQNFTVGHEYSGNLFNIGAHYSQYLRLMAYWRDFLSTGFLEIDYELLVTQPESSIRTLIEYCGLEWEENCLYFNKLKRDVKTASFDQVRQPIYTKSIDRWKHYDKYLDNLKSGLERGY